MTADEVTGLLIEDNPTDALLLKELVADGRARLKLLHAERLEDGLALFSELSLSAYGSSFIRSHDKTPEILRRTAVEGASGFIGQQ